MASGDIRPVEWKSGTTDTLESVPITDSIMAIADADYFDWAVLPEAPSSLNVVRTGNTVKLTWEVHGGDPQNVIVERREDSTNGRGAWREIAKLGAGATEFKDGAKSGQQLTYRVRARNASGDSASSNFVRIAAP